MAQAVKEAKPKGSEPKKEKKEGAGAKEKKPRVRLPDGYRPRLMARYWNEVAPAFQKDFQLPNVLAVPRLEKLVVNMGVGRSVQNKNILDQAVQDLTMISGQKPLVTKARKAEAGFKLRKGMAIGVKVTLRRKRMYEFLDRLVSLAIPRIRDFRGLNPTSVDAWGHYTFGISEQLIFPEIRPDQVETVQGMDITLVVNTDAFPKSEKKKMSYELLKRLGLPFRTDIALNF